MINSLPVDKFRQIILGGYNPYHFWGQSNSTIPVTSNCNTIVNEYGWQNGDAAGRDDIREAIATAETRLFEYLGYRVGSRWVTKELQYPWPYDAGLQYAYPADVKGRWLSMDIQEGYIQDVGIEAFTTLDIDASVTYSDQYSDTLPDTATITVDITGISPAPTADEIAIFFVSGDRLDGDDKTNYEIRPIKASISGNTLTIKVRSWLLVKPINYQGWNKPAIDPSDNAAAGSFAEEVEVYRRYNDATGILTTDSQAVLIWESDPPIWACNASDNLTYDNRNDPYSIAQAIARVNIRDRRLGYLGGAWSSYNSDTGEFTAITWQGKQPDRIIIRYRAGANRNEIESQLPGGSWDHVVSRLAAAELSRKICACDQANRDLHRWQQDLSQTGGNNDISFQAVSPEQLNNPFGTRRGAVYAWNQVKNLKLSKAAIV